MSIISSLTDAGEPIEVQDLYARFTLDTASEALFGERLDTLHRALPIPGKSTMSAKGSATKDEFGDFVQSFEVAQEIVVRRSGKGYFWPATQLLKDDIEPHADVISKFLEPMISRVLRNKAQMKKAGIVPTVEQSTFLDYLADNTEGTLRNMFPRVCYINFFIQQTRKLFGTSYSTFYSLAGILPRAY